MRETRLSLYRKLSLLVRENYSSLFKLHGNDTSILSYLDMSKPCIVDLGVVRDLSVRKLYASLLVKRLVDSAISTKKPVLIVLEEAQNYLHKNSVIKPICNMLREVRKFNVGLIVISQSIGQLVDDTIANTNTKIIHSIKSKRDLEVIKNMLYLDRSLLSIIPYLEPGKAVYSTIGLRKPVLVKVE